MSIPPRTGKGRFAKGTSGNPAGRPRSSLTGKVRDRIAGHVDELVDLLLEKARLGDVQAARTLLERVAPALRPEEAPVHVSVPPGSDLSATGHAVLAAATSGAVPPGQAAAVIGALGHLARVVETDELMRRVEALEERTRAGT